MPQSYRLIDLRKESIFVTCLYPLSMRIASPAMLPEFHRFDGLGVSSLKMGKALPLPVSSILSSLGFQGQYILNSDVAEPQLPIEGHPRNQTCLTL